MATPIVISTWPFGLKANAAAWVILAGGGAALDAVEAGATQCEDDPSEHSVGLGGYPDASGEVTLDASIMDHTGRCGAVACLHRIKNAARVARLVMERTPHVMLVGEAATRFAIAQGLPETNLLTEAAREAFLQWKFRHAQAAAEAPAKKDSHDTLGILALDAAGHLAGACTTSGMAFKLPGRVGDSPLIGAGLYVDGQVGAATATGVGEEMIKVCASHAIVENLRRGMEPVYAIREVLHRVMARRDGNADTDVSLLALRLDGVYAGASLRRETNFRFAVTDASQSRLYDAPSLL